MPNGHRRLRDMVSWSERYLKTDVTYLLRSGLWSNFGTISVSLGSLLLYIVFAHFVPKEVYGTYQYLLSLGAIVGSLTLTGMNMAVARSVAMGYEGALRHAVRLQLKWNTVPFLAAMSGAAYYFSHDNMSLAWSLVLIGIFVPINSALNTYGGFLLGKQDFRRGFLFSLWWNVPYYAAVAVCAYVSDSAILLLGANLVSQAIGLGIAYIHTVRTYHPNERTDPDTMRYGGHLSAMGLFGSVAAQADSILAFHYLGAADLALYAFATAIPDRLSALFKFIPSAAFPRFSNKKPREIRVGLARRLLIGLAVSLVMAVAYMATARLFFSFLFPQYIEAVPLSILYSLIMCSSMTGVLINALTAAGNVKALYIFNVVNPILSLVLQLGGILLFGLMGLVAARLISAAFSLFLSTLLYWRTD